MVHGQRLECAFQTFSYSGHFTLQRGVLQIFGLIQEKVFHDLMSESSYKKVSPCVFLFCMFHVLFIL